MGLISEGGEGDRLRSSAAACDGDAEDTGELGGGGASASAAAAEAAGDGVPVAEVEAAPEEGVSRSFTPRGAHEGDRGDEIRRPDPREDRLEEVSAHPPPPPSSSSSGAGTAASATSAERRS